MKWSKTIGAFRSGPRQAGREWLNSRALRKIGGAVIAAIFVVNLSACVESEAPLLTDTQPLAGQEFEVHFYENFVDRKAGNFHTTVYRWNNSDAYVRETRSAQDVASFAAKPISENDFIIQGADHGRKLFNYWLGRKLYDGVYLIFPLNELDADETTRNSICAKNQPDGVCRITAFDQLVTLARATAAKPVRNPALGVLVAR